MDPESTAQDPSPNEKSLFGIDPPPIPVLAPHIHTPPPIADSTDQKEIPEDLAKELAKARAELELHRRSDEPQILSEEESESEKRKMGDAFNWIKKPIVSRVIKYGSRIPKTFEFTSGNIAMLYRGNTFIRFVPFVARNDLLSDQTWAEFKVNSYYNKPSSPLPWDWSTYKILWMGLDKGPDYCDNLGGGGLLIKVDEHAKAQLPLRFNLSEEERQKLLKNNRMNGQALLLKDRLQSYEKPKQNWWFWFFVIMGVMAVAVVVMLYFIYPNAFNNFFAGITKSFSGIGKAFTPPGSAGTSGLSSGTTK